MSALLQSTVKRIFDALESRAIRYAVLRNYDQLPSLCRPGEAHPHTDIDLVVDSGDMEEVRRILSGVAETDGWDALTDCDHWSQSPIRHHNIHVFRFYRGDPLAYLQIDVFHGLLLWALPLFDEQQLLSGRIYEEARSLTHIDPLKENVFLLFQIAGHWEETPPKAARYRDKVLAFRVSEPERFERGLRRVLSRYALEAVDALERPNWSRFLRKIRMARLLFAVRFAVRRPFHTLWYVMCRMYDHSQRFVLRQCGCRVRVHAASEVERDALRGVLNELVERSCLDCWKEYENPTFLRWQDHRIMEQNAVVIEWTNLSDSQIDLSRASDRRSCLDEILAVLVERHPRLYARFHRTETGVLQEAAQ